MKRAIALLLISQLAGINAAFCEPQRSLKTSGSGNNTLQVSPESLGSHILNQNVELMTRDGTYVKGKVLRTSAEEITLKIKKVEPKNRISGQEATLRPVDIAVINMKKSGSRVWPITLGIFGGLMAGGAVAGATTDGDSGGSAVGGLILGAMAAGATGGVILGKRIARKTVVINVGPRANP